MFDNAPVEHSVNVYAGEFDCFAGWLDAEPTPSRMDPANGDLGHDPIALSDLALHRKGQGRIGLMATLDVGFRTSDTARVPHIIEDFDIVRGDELWKTFNVSIIHHFFVEPSNESLILLCGH